jgi:hydroxymethylpyrimidine pyrophosphatase-like HAD family hydrolase
MHTISLIAVDLDGTLLLSGTKRLAVEGSRLLRAAAARGIHIVLATARTPHSTREFCAEMDLHDPIIGSGGAQILGSPGGPVWASFAIPLQAARAIAEYADACNWELSTTIGEMTYWCQRPGQELGQVAPNRVIVRNNSAALPDPLAGEVYAGPVRILAFQPDAIAGLVALCAAGLSDFCRADIFYSAAGRPNSLGIFPAGADKGTALRLIQERLGISPAETLAIGDNSVDLPMFEAAAWSVAMGNAPPEVKRRAGAVSPSNDDEGVAWAVKNFVPGLEQL